MLYCIHAELSCAVTRTSLGNSLSNQGFRIVPIIEFRNCSGCLFHFQTVIDYTATSVANNNPAVNWIAKSGLYKLSAYDIGVTYPSNHYCHQRISYKILLLS